MVPPNDFSGKNENDSLFCTAGGTEGSINGIFLRMQAKNRKKQQFGCRRASIQEKASWQREMFSVLDG